MKLISYFTPALVLLVCSNTSANSECDGCTAEESTSMQQHQFLDTVKILKLIHSESYELDQKTLEFYLGRYGSKEEVQALLSAFKKPSSEIQKKSSSANAKKPKPPMVRKSLTILPRGLEGLSVAHAQTENPAIGFGASATLVSHGRPYPLGIGNSFKHNKTSYVLEGVTEYSNSDGSTGHSVSVKNITTGMIDNLPWNLGVKK